MSTISEEHVSGLAALNKLLETLPDKIRKNILRGALRQGAKVFEGAAKAGAPVGPPSTEARRLYGGYAGALRDSIRVTTRVRGGTTIASVVAGGKKRGGADVFYAHMIEYTGAQAHVVKPLNKKALFLGGAFFLSVDHPGFAAQPFMRPAFDTRWPDAVAAVAQKLRDRLTKQGLDTADISVEGES